MWHKLQDLTEEEIAACEQYYSDSTFFHACAQGWSRAFCGYAPFDDFIGKLSQLRNNLDNAIQKFSVTTDCVVYSGHSTGISIIGSLNGNPERFVGLQYCYSGFISTSSHRNVAEDFLRKRASSGSRPVLLECHLEREDRALPLACVTKGAGEGELLLGRQNEFAIRGAHFIKVGEVADQVLHLELKRP